MLKKEATTRQVTRQQKDEYSRLMRLPAAARSLKTRGVCHSHGKSFENSSTYTDFMINSTALGLYPTRGQKYKFHNHLMSVHCMIIFNRSSRRKRGMASNPLFIIPDFFLHFPNELCYGYLRFEGIFPFPSNLR